MIVNMPGSIKTRAYLIDLQYILKYSIDLINYFREQQGCEGVLQLHPACSGPCCRSSQRQIFV
jgi:hypothetical protein